MFYFPIYWEESSSQVTNSYFSEGLVETTNHIYNIYIYYYIWYHIPSRISLIYHWYIHENHVILRGSLSVWSLRSPWRRQRKRWRRPGVVWRPQVIKRGYGKSTTSPINGKIMGKSREIPELNREFVRWENLRVILGHGDFLSHDDWRVNSSVLWSKICVNLPLLVGRDSFAGCVYTVNSWMRLTHNAGCLQFIFMRIYIPIISYTNCNESVMMVGWPYSIYIYNVLTMTHM